MRPANTAGANGGANVSVGLRFRIVPLPKGRPPNARRRSGPPGSAKARIDKARNDKASNVPALYVQTRTALARNGPVPIARVRIVRDRSEEARIGEARIGDRPKSAADARIRRAWTTRDPNPCVRRPASTTRGQCPSAPRTCLISGTRRRCRNRRAEAPMRALAIATGTRAGRMPARAIHGTMSARRPTARLASLTTAVRDRRAEARPVRPIVVWSVVARTAGGMIAEARIGGARIGGARIGGARIADHGGAPAQPSLSGAPMTVLRAGRLATGAVIRTLNAAHMRPRPNAPIRRRGRGRPSRAETRRRSMPRSISAPTTAAC